MTSKRLTTPGVSKNQQKVHRLTTSSSSAANNLINATPELEWNDLRDESTTGEAVMSSVQAAKRRFFGEEAEHKNHVDAWCRHRISIRDSRMEAETDPRDVLKIEG